MNTINTKSMESYLIAWETVNIRARLIQWGGQLKDAMLKTKAQGGAIYICGNGGSAANAIHMANDFTYGYCEAHRRFNVEALSANSSVLTCLANDIGYENIYSHQVENKADKKDLLIVLSGSGNSPNIIRAVEAARNKGVSSLGILGYDGGKAKDIVNISIHTAIDDMQVAEDLQLMIAHAAIRMMDGN